MKGISPIKIARALAQSRERRRFIVFNKSIGSRGASVKPGRWIGNQCACLVRARFAAVCGSAVEGASRIFLTVRAKSSGVNGF